MARQLTLRQAPPPEVVAERLDEIRARIERAGAAPDAVTIVAVTKGFHRSAVDSALEAGIEIVGENYAAELLAKALPGQNSPTWHFIGSIQRRTIGALAPVVSCWQSVWRAEEGKRIAERAPGSSVFVELNLAGDPRRPGVTPEHAPPLVAQLRDLGLDVRGLMGVAPAGPPDAARPGFRSLARLAGELGLRERSMGMSGDLEVAVAEGTTMVRIGTALFGPRVTPGR
ncbi:MAG: YggS family pyridoxal phosphate enzyme [Acidimicrobiales bacterium]